MNREIELKEIFQDTCASDKLAHNYAPVYANVSKNIGRMLELGVAHGFSLLAWLQAFPMAEIYGVDITLDLAPSALNLTSNPRVKLIQADVRSFEPQNSLPNFDLVVDDCSHQIKDILRMWDKLYLKTKSVYIIEDLDFERMIPIWQHITKAVPKHQMILWRTSDCDGRYQHIEGDSHCLIVKMENR